MKFITNNLWREEIYLYGIIGNWILSFLAIQMFRFKRGLAHALYKEMIPKNGQNMYVSPVILHHR